MTPKEALSVIILEYCFTNEEQNEALTIMKNLITKSTPMKPQTREISAGTCGMIISFPICPNCKDSGIVYGDYQDKHKFCPNCGQRLDWSDE